MKFDNKLFTYDGLYLKYDGRFVARFKYGGMAAFKKFLRANFTVSEYFHLLESSLGPLKVLETKGYVSPVVAKSLKARGYPATQAGFKQMIEDDVARMTAKKETVLC
jgi:hypothetical protein